MRKPIELRYLIIYIMGIPLLCVAVFFIYMGYHKAKAQVVEDMNRVLLERTSRQAAELNLFFGRMSRYADSIATVLDSTGQLDKEIYYSLLNNVLNFDGISAAIIAFNEDAFSPNQVPFSPLGLKKKSRIYFHPFSKQEYYDYNYYDWFLLPKLAQANVWVDPLYSRIQDAVICVYSAPFFKKKKFQGVVSLSVSIEEISQKLEVINFEGSQLILVSQFGTIVAYPNKDFILRHTLISLADEIDFKPLKDFVSDLRAQDKSGVIRFDKGFLSNNEYIAYVPIPQTNWLLLSVIPESVILSPLMQNIWSGVILIGIGSVLVFIIIYWLSTLEIVRPLRLLEDAATQLANGKLNTQAKTNSSVSEILSLENAFNTMVMQLGESMTKEIEAGRARSYAEEASKAKSDFLARMSHEIRTPMNAILGLTHLALVDLTKFTGEPAYQEKQHNYLLKIQRASKNMLAILNDILDFSKIEAGKLELELAPFNVIELASGLEDMFTAVAHEKDVAFKIHLSPKLPLYLQGDVLRLTQVLLNLCNNAMKFTCKGNIDIYFNVLESDTENCTIEIRVKDTGIGIANEIQNQVFHKFSQADSSTTRKFGGTGLGLAICKLLVELMQGQIRLESTLGVGSTFIVTVPLVIVKDLPLLIKEPMVKALSIPAQAKILVAEDNEINQEIIVALLENMNLCCHVVGNGREALKALAKEDFKLVLMDIQMPEMDGLTATIALRKLGYSIPVLAMTANALLEDRDKCLEVGMNAHIPKPIDPKELEEQLSFWLNVNSY